MAKRKKFDLDRTMAEATNGRTPAKSKSKIPVVDVPELKSEIAAWCKADEDVKTLQSLQATAELEIRPTADRLRLKAARDRREFLNSVKLRGVSGGPVLMLTQKTQFASIAQESKPVLLEACDETDVDYDEYFSSIPVVSVKKDLDVETLTNVIRTLIETFGEKWVEYFDVKYPIQVDPNFAKDLVFDAKVQKLFERMGPEQGEGIISPHKATLKRA